MSNVKLCNLQQNWVDFQGYTAFVYLALMFRQPPSNKGLMAFCGLFSVKTYRGSMAT